jgi:trimethylamine--corrinoid protein Co-methyltransferase
MDPNARKFSADPLEYLTKEQMREIHSAALEILEDLGTEVHHDEAVQLLRREGAHVRDGNRVFIPTALTERAVIFNQTTSDNRSEQRISE